MLDHLKDIVKEICDERNIKYTFLSKNWIVKLERDGKIAFIVGSRFSINSVTAASIAADKYATFEVLKSANIPIIEHKMVFNKRYRKGYNSDLNSRKEILDYINSMPNKKIVVKANEGSCGNDVYLCKNIHEVCRCLNKMFKHKESASICPFYDIDTEYRIICLDNEPKLIYGKRACDGMWKHNLSQGASVVEVEDEKLKNKLIEIAINAVKAIGIRFASVDIIKLKTGELLVIEVNSGVTINKYTDFVSNGRETAKEVYGEAIEKMLM